MTCIRIIFCHSESAHHCFANLGERSTRPNSVCVYSIWDQALVHLQPFWWTFVLCLKKKKMHAVKKKKVRQDYIEQICHQKGAAKTLKQVAVINCKSFYYFEFQHV